MKNKWDPLETFIEEEFDLFLLDFIDKVDFEFNEEPDYWDNFTISDEEYSIEDFFFPKNISVSNVISNQR